MPGDTSFFDALLTSLRSDVGAGSLVALTGHKTTDQRIIRGEMPQKGVRPFLSVGLINSRPLIKEHTFIKRYLLSFTALATTEVVAMQIGDRLEVLFHKMNFSNPSFYDFTNSNVKVMSTLWKSRTRTKYDEDTDGYSDMNVVEIVANPFQGC